MFFHIYIYFFFSSKDAKKKYPKLGSQAKKAEQDLSVSY